MSEENGLAQKKGPLDDLVTQKQLKLSNLERECFCNNKALDNGGFFECSNPKCQKVAHRVCIPWRVQDYGEFECTSCIMMTNDPLKEPKHIFIEPSLIKSGFEYSFKLSFDRYYEINDDSELDVEIRCIKMDGEHFFEHTWPDKCEIFINGRKIKELKPLSQNSSLKKRRDEKLTIPLSVLNHGTNSLCFSYVNVQDGKNTKFNKDPLYVFSLLMAQKLSKQELMRKIIQNHSKPKSESKKLIKEKFFDNKDIKISEVKADLICKLTLTHLKHPARGINCTHLNCFSLGHFIELMQKIATKNWFCPLCHKPCYKLEVDAYLENLVQRALKADPQNSQVIFSKDGGYEFVRSGDLAIETTFSQSRGNNSLAGKLDSKMNKEILQKNPTSFAPSSQKSRRNCSKDSLVDAEIVSIEDSTEPAIVTFPKIPVSINKKPVLNPATLPPIVIEPKSASNKISKFSGESLLGKRDRDFHLSSWTDPNTPYCLDDEEFVLHLFNFVRQKKKKLMGDLLYQGNSLGTSFKPQLDNFKASLKERLRHDYFTRKFVQLFYQIVMKKKEEVEKNTSLLSTRQKYDALFKKLGGGPTDKSDICFKEKTDFDKLDVFQSVLKGYKIDIPPELSSNQQMNQPKADSPTYIF